MGVDPNQRVGRSSVFGGEVLPYSSTVPP
jgi:hypothetical protein